MSIPELFWAPSFSPYASFGAVPVTAVRDALCQQFCQWGRPECLRVDNGVPWGNWNDLPTPFALWVVGIGVRWHWNDPCRPQQNPKVERSQGTSKRWCEPHTCQSVEELQQRLDEADEIQRHDYPTISGVSRWDLFPQLKHSGRAYSCGWARDHWSLLAVQQHLSEYVAVRLVDCSGHISIYDRGRYVGKQYQGQRVQVQYDPDAEQWLISDAQGREIRRHAAVEISREQIETMSFRKKRHKK